MLQISAEYKTWIIDLKTRLRSLQIKAAVSVNAALLELYWELGADIIEKGTRKAQKPTIALTPRSNLRSKRLDLPHDG